MRSRDQSTPAGVAVEEQALGVEELEGVVREQLAGFQRVTVLPNENKTVEIALPASRLAYWDVKLQAFRVEAEPVSLVIGNSSANIALTATVQVQ